MNLIKLNEISKSIEDFCKHYSINYSVKETHYEIYLNNFVLLFIPLLESIDDVSNLKYNQVLVGVDKLTDTKGFKYISTKELYEIINEKNCEKYNSFVMWATNKLFFSSNDSNFIVQKELSNNKVNKKSSDNKKNIFDKYGISLNNKFDATFTFYSKGKAFISKEKNICIISLISKNYYRTSYNYWYSYHPYQKDLAANYNHSYLLLAFKGEDDFLLIPISYIDEKLNILGFSPKPDKNGNPSKYWNIHVKRNGDELFIRIPNRGLRNISEYICLLDNTEKDYTKEIVGTLSNEKKRNCY